MSEGRRFSDAVEAMEVPHRSSLDVQEQCKSEEVEAKRWMDRASRYLIECRYESAIQLLQKTESIFPNCKNLPELMAVTQVCYAATWRACHCARPYTRKLPDWYHVLKVDERADFDTIKKRYRQLALLLHPDKNKHANSEGAFKVITEAYACLSDKEKRDAFNLERRRSVCTTCSRKAQQQAAGHISSRLGVKTLQAPSNAFSTPTESDSLQNLRERAKARVNTLERDWGGKTSKWMQNLASVRQRYWNVAGDSPVRASMESPFRRENPRVSNCEEDVHTRPKVPSSPILLDSTPKVAAKLDFNTFEVRRASSSDANKDDLKTGDESIDDLLKRLRAEKSAAAIELESPLSREFSIHARTPEAAHLMRPLSVGKTRKSSSTVDHKCEGGSLYSSWMPKGRCLSKKAPLSPTKVRRFANTVHVERVVPRSMCPSSELHKGSQTNTVDQVRRSSSVRLESLYPTSPINLKEEVPSSLKKEMHESARTSSVRLEKRDSSFSFNERLSSATPKRSSSVRLESVYPSSPKQDKRYSKLLDSEQPVRSSSVRLENPYQPESDFTVQQWSRVIARTASGSWTNGVKTHPEFFDDVFTPVSPATIRTPIRKEIFVLKTTPPSDSTSPKFSSRMSNPLPDQSQRRYQPGNMTSSTRRTERLASRVLNRVSTAEDSHQEDRPPLGSRSENLASYSSKIFQDRKDSKISPSILEKERASRLERLEDMERKQKSDAVNGILERLRSEAKTVAVTLDRLRDNMGAENMTR